ncbi:beta-galactosidase [Streptomyces sp. Amel2xB2]|uniref:beta-galactosidase n=1 Tax=Streptomyces sp. Amel2xB2 TaxID=1305829 RepID=UPI000DB91F9B|nr:beta-galactosidase [Streptomyces sp. Amel2xB2]RAJ69859.1 beta-galactosidase [Streptomyces sp. Amel2xB2]
MTSLPADMRRRAVLGGAGAIAVAATGATGLGATPAYAAPGAAQPSAPAAPRTGASVSYDRKRLLVDGEPVLVLAGEIHYFRLKRSDWQSRLDLAEEAGLNTIATYIPWMWHETADGSLDVTGRTRPERDLGAFLDLCIDNGFHVLARPGPFTMAELKGEGVPLRVRKKHPEIVPKGWDGEKDTAQTIDYLAPAFLKEARRWYDAVIPVIAERRHRKGRPGVIACQLDNEIGMLPWVSNHPALTDGTVKAFDSWLRETYGDGLGKRYPFADKPADERAAAVRAPKDAYAPALMHDLGAFTRGRLAQYVRALRESAEDNGLTGVPFLINIHGTSDDGAKKFPIGISQLKETWTGERGIFAGSDFYLGGLTVKNVTDLYLINALTESVQDADQPLAALEFDAGHADYGDNLDNQEDAEAGDLKTRLCVAQGVKMINYYLFAGGFNPKLDKPVGDGNDRIGITGERHGFSAPVDPEGRRNLTYEPLKRTVHAVGGLAKTLAGMVPEYDDVSVGFVPDHYLTEYHPPGRASVDAILGEIEEIRGFGPRGALTRAMLLGGFRYRAVDLQSGRLDPDRTPVLALATGKNLATGVQRELVRYLEAGGKLLLSGRVPEEDMAGHASTQLRDALGLKTGKTLTDADRFWLSATAHGWAAPRAEVRVAAAQLCTAERGTTVLREVSTGKGCGFDVRVGKGRAVVITTDYRCDLDFWRRALKVLGAAPDLTHSSADPGLVLLTTRSVHDDGDSGPGGGQAGAGRGAGGRLLHVLNVTSGLDQEFTVSERGRPLFGGERLRVPGRSGAMLPLGLPAGGGRIAYATAEITGIAKGSVTFRAVGGGESVVAVEGGARCEGAKSSREGGRTVLRVRRPEFTVRLG